MTVFNETESKTYHLGIVKWFGGYNHKREKENDFGFIESMSGDDVYIHKNDIANDDRLIKNQLVVFEISGK